MVFPPGGQKNSLSKWRRMLILSISRAKGYRCLPYTTPRDPRKYIIYSMTTLIMGYTSGQIRLTVRLLRSAWTGPDGGVSNNLQACQPYHIHPKTLQQLEVVIRCVFLHPITTFVAKRMDFISVDWVSH